MKKPKFAVVVVHGISDKKGDQQENFSKRLAENVMPDLAIRDKYWLEALWEKVNDKADDKIQDIILQTIGLYDKTDYFRDAVLEKLQGPKFVKKFAWWYLQRKIWNKGTVDTVVKGFDLLLDLPLYLGNPRGERIRKVVVDRIREAKLLNVEGVVLVGHSLGSVIAYDVVRKSLVDGKSSLPIKAFVTMGSPLAWVTDLRIAEGDIPNCSCGIGNIPWFNFYDVADPVAMKNKLPEDRFPGMRNEPPIETGLELVDAHTAYWGRHEIANKISELIW